MTKENKKTLKLIAILIALLLTYSLVDYYTMPKECRGSDVSKLSQFCLDLRFPNN